MPTMVLPYPRRACGRPWPSANWGVHFPTRFLRSVPLLLLCALVGANTDGAEQAPVDSNFPVWEKSIAELQAAMTSGRVTSRLLVAAYLRRIAAYDQHGPALNTIIRLNPRADADAAALDSERMQRGPRGPLHGIPILLKDNYDARGLPTTAGSISLAGAQAIDDAFVVARLRAAGAVILGKTNMMEFALGVYTVSSVSGFTRNPYDPALSPGGSSGGSAAAVAASLAAVALGTDTCGSIRVPAAFNGLVGLRPTKGLTSTRGIVPLCHSMDVAGALARSVGDLATTLDVIVGVDSADASTLRWAGQTMPRFAASLDSTSLRGARIGVLKEFFGTSAGEQETSDTVRAALARMQAAGATLVPVSIPGLDSLSLSGNVVSFEFREDLATYLQGHSRAPVRTLHEILGRGLYLAELQSLYAVLDTSAGTNSAAYATAVAQRRRLADTLSAVLAANRLDALAYPTVRTGPNRVDTPQQNPNCEASANSGFPAISMPVGLAADGVPIGLELLGGPLTDARLVSLAYAWERLAQPRTAPLFTPELRQKAAPKPASVRVVIRQDSMVATGIFTFNASTGDLQYSVQVAGIPVSQLLVVSLHQSPDSGLAGPAILPLTLPGSLRNLGTVRLQIPARAALHAGHLFITVLTTRYPLGTLKVRIPAPATPPIVNPLLRPQPSPSTP